MIYLCAWVYVKWKSRPTEKIQCTCTGNQLLKKKKLLKKVLTWDSEHVHYTEVFPIIHNTHLFVRLLLFQTIFPLHDLTVTLPSHSHSHPHPDILSVGITASDCLESGNSSKCDFYITLTPSPKNLHSIPSLPPTRSL